MRHGSIVRQGWSDCAKDDATEASRGRSRLLVREQTMASQGHFVEHSRHDSKLHVHPMTPEQQIALVQEARAARLREHGCPIARSGAEGPKIARVIR